MKFAMEIHITQLRNHSDFGVSFAYKIFDNPCCWLVTANISTIGTFAIGD